MKNVSVQAIYNWYRDLIKNPKYRWWVIGASLLYLVSPLDISPDVFPIVGWLDDGIIAGLLVAEVSQLLLDRLKGTRNESVGEQSPSPTETTAAKTVDINAVSAE